MILDVGWNDVARLVAYVYCASGGMMLDMVGGASVGEADSLLSARSRAPLMRQVPDRTMGK